MVFICVIVICFTCSGFDTIMQKNVNAPYVVSGLAEKLGAKLVNSMPAITRGLKLSPFWSTTGATIYIKELDIISPFR